MKLLLNIESGSLGGRQYELTDGFLTIGRSENCAVRFDPFQERIASSQHAFIEAKPDGFYLIDNKSTNGTLLNGQQIQSAKLNNKDVIQFGKLGLTYWHIQRATAAQGQTGSFQQNPILREEVLK